MQDNVKNIDLISKLTTSEFLDFCNQNLVPQLVPLEKQRVQKLKTLKLFALCNKAGIFIMLILFFAALVFAIISRNNMNNELGLLSTKCSGLVLLTSVLLVYASGFMKSKKDSIEKEFKQNFYNKLLSFLGDFSYFEGEIDSWVYDSLKQEVANLKLFSKNNIFYCDDLIKGVYNGLNVCIGDIKLEYKSTTSTSSTPDTVFNGVLVCCDSNKNFKSTTVIKKEEGALVNSLYAPDGLEKVKLEDPIFEESFEAYSNDQIEARYLLTTAFMERLLTAQKKLKTTVTCSFENGKMYIAINIDKNWFDVDIIQNSLTDLKTYQKILMDLITVLSVIEVLRIDEKTGM